jgi:diguanylate cyclase (GGDEF)-like protein
MPFAVSPHATPLDVPTLLFVAVCLTAALGLFLIFAWLTERSVRALAWWGAAYLIGASSLALWSAPAPFFRLPADIPAALIFVACGMIWNGVRLFRGRPILPAATFAGAIVWVGLCQLPGATPGSNLRIALSALVVAVYTFCIAFELWRERRKSLYSRSAAVVVPLLHAVIFSAPLALKVMMPAEYAAEWLEVFALETMIYVTGTAFIVMLMVKDYHLHVERHAASTDSLTGLLNRRAFMENAMRLCLQQAKRGQPVTLLMFDLDHFKRVNDRFGHAAGDEVLRVFAQTARSSMRANDIIGRLGGEEFAAIVPAPLDIASKIAERLRVAFEAAGAVVGVHAIGATVSIGAAEANAPVVDVAPLLSRADAALYRAKNDGRNRLCTADSEPVSEAALQPDLPDLKKAAVASAAVSPRQFHTQRAGKPDAAARRTAATSRLPYSR